MKIMVVSENSVELDNNETKKDKNYFQVDILKALMIFLVIFDHTIPWSIKDNLGVSLWERISIPVFMVILGFNFGK
jgi:surface polysaccharide O-acyltransferase-like enzyme